MNDRIERAWPLWLAVVVSWTASATALVEGHVYLAGALLLASSGVLRLLLWWTIRGESKRRTRQSDGCD